MTICPTHGSHLEIHMNSDRIEGAAKRLVSAAKEVAGRIAGNAKLADAGRAQRRDGTVQSTVVGLEDFFRK
jgi:uncharacterized protein YjbJ (UPF0337 family)